MQASEGIRKSRGAATASKAIAKATEVERGIDMTATMMSVTTQGVTRGAAMQMKKGLGGTGIADLIMSGALQGNMTETADTRHTETGKSSHERHNSRDDRSREQHRRSKSSGQRVGDASLPAKKSNPDFDREIPGYAKMTPAERMKGPGPSSSSADQQSRQANTVRDTCLPPGSHSSVQIVCLILPLCYRT